MLLYAVVLYQGNEDWNFYKTKTANSEVVQRSRIGRKNYEFGLGIHGEPGAQQAKFESVDKM